MVELRAKGFSYWKIADILNSIGVPTKTRKGKWQPRFVKTVLDTQLYLTELRLVRQAISNVQGESPSSAVLEPRRVDRLQRI
jgi:hypothetical protein